MEGEGGAPAPIKAGTGMVLSITGLGQRKKPGTSANGAFGAKGGASAMFGGGAEDGEDEPKAQFITSLDDGKKEAVTKAPLVIQLSEPRWRREAQAAAAAAPPKPATAVGGDGAGEGGGGGASLEHMAAEQLAREARGEGTGDDDKHAMLGTRVIHLSAGNGDPEAPMLVRNAVPIPKDLTDEKARLKYELSLREDDIDSSSDVYKAVPVAEFGAALLRGMGWQGPSADDIEVFQVKARPEGLGLGADPAVMELDAQGKKKRRGVKHDSEKAKAALAKAAEERIKKQVLKDGDVVRIKEGKMAGKRAVITKADGVAGIQMMEIELETVGDLIRVKTTEVFKVSARELDDDPFARKASSSSRGGRGAAEEEEQEKRRKRSRSGSRESKSKKKKKDRKRSRSRDRRDGSGGGGDENGSKSKKRALEDSATAGASSRANGGEGGGSSSSSSDWLVPKIRVRVVTEKAVGGHKQSFYRRTGFVVDVPRPGEATVKMESGEVLEGMKVRHLETALPSVNGCVLVLRGRHRHRKAKLLEKDRDREEGVVQLEDLSVHRLSLDDIAEYRGRGDDEMSSD